MEKKIKKANLLGSGIKLSILTLVSRILGLGREMTKAALLGTTPLADAFGIAFMIPNLFRRLFAENSASVAFIPAFRSYLEDGDRRESLRFVSSVFTVISFVTALIVAVGVIASPLLVPFFYDGNQSETITEMIFLTRIMFPYLFLISIAAVFQGILNSLNIFAPSGFTPILFNIIVIAASYLLSPLTANPARAMAIGVIAGGTVQAAFQFPFVVRSGWGTGFTSLRRAWSNTGVKTMMRRIAPTIVGMAAYQLNDMVSTALAGRAGSGIVAALQYSLRLQELMLGIFAVSIGTVILPDLSALAGKKDWTAFNSMISSSLKIIALITIPFTLFALVSGESIIVAVYQGRSFNADSTALTLRIFICHIMGLFFIAANRILSPAFYARGNTKLPTLAGVISFVVNMILAWSLVGPFSGIGIASALSIASAVNTILLVVFLKAEKRTGMGAAMKMLPVLVYAVKILVFSFAASLALFFLRPKILALLSGLYPRITHALYSCYRGLCFRRHRNPSSPPHPRRSPCVSDWEDQGPPGQKRVLTRSAKPVMFQNENSLPSSSITRPENVPQTWRRFHE